LLTDTFKHNLKYNFRRTTRESKQCMQPMHISFFYLNDETLTAYNLGKFHVVHKLLQVLQLATSLLKNSLLVSYSPQQYLCTTDIHINKQTKKLFTHIYHVKIILQKPTMATSPYICDIFKMWDIRQIKKVTYLCLNIIL
jgi:hypothetical protein